MAEMGSHSDDQLHRHIVPAELAAIKGAECCRQRVGRGRSLSLGFGERVHHGKSELEDTFYGTWELGSYYPIWRILINDDIVMGHADAFDSISDMNEILSRIKIGRLKNVMMLNHLDISIECEGDIHIEFMPATSDEDDVFHVFLPNNIFVGFQPKRGWLLDKRD